ncbi:hypothetical protein [Stenotrophomonas sp. PE591]|uniref:hypothetical protein n=1 Tax=Stenotrophomonas sp. PE591 TaxID=1812490 RepID=UPI00117CCD2C|nr:hypothetical protein [Stenotrophomonas sp. PE591]MBS3725100.1 hypothetical protein [Stenotrophomonas sp. PE591]
MKNKKFWTKAFLSALARLPAEEAKLEADKATELCKKHFELARSKSISSKVVRWKDQKIF